MQFIKGGSSSIATGPALVGPYYFFIGFLAAHGLDLKAFVQQLLGTKISTFFAIDLLISSVVFVGYLRQEATRYSIGRSWLFLVPLLSVGLSFALPLFLYVRESHVGSKAQAADSVKTSE